MKVTAMDITNKEFKKGFRGYDIDEVDEFLDKIAEDYEVLYKENSSLKEKMGAMEENLNHSVRMEETIQNTLILAQNAAEQSKKAAQKEADMIIKNANETAQKILDKAHNDVVKINDDFEKTKQDFTIFRTKFKNFMHSQVEMFQNMENDFIKDYNVGSTVEEVKCKCEDKQEIADEPVDDELMIEEIKEIEEEGSKEEDINKSTMDEIKNFFVK